MSTPSAPSGGAPAASSAPSTSSAPKTSNPAPQSAPKAPASSSAPSSSGGTSSSAPATTGKTMADIASAKVNDITGNGAQPQGDVAAPQAPVEAKPEPRTFRIKVGGQEREVSEEQAIRYAQLGYGADAKFQEAAKMRQSAEALFRALKEDPMSVLTHPELGINFRELAEQHLAKEIQREMMPPEQRELEELREFRRKQEEQAKNAEKEQLTKAQQAEQQALTQRAAEKYNKDISEALTKSDLPRSPDTLKRVAGLLLNARQKGYDLDVNTAVDMVRDSYHNELKSLVGGLEGESLIKFFGDEMVNRIRKYDLARIRSKLGVQETPQEQVSQEQPQERAPSRRRESTPDASGLRSSDWIAMLRKKAGIED